MKIFLNISIYYILILRKILVCKNFQINFYYLIIYQKILLLTLLTFKLNLWLILLNLIMTIHLLVI